MHAEAETQQRISSGYAALVALYQLLQTRSAEPGRAPSADWAARLAVLRVLREGEVPGDRAALATALLDPARRDVRHFAVSVHPERLGELVAESVRLGERVLLFGTPDALPGDVLAVDASGAPVGPAWSVEIEDLGTGLGLLSALEPAAETLRRARTARESAEAVAVQRRAGLATAIDTALGAKAQARAAAEHAAAAFDGAVDEERAATADAAARLAAFTEAKAAADTAADAAAAAGSAAQAAHQRAAAIEQRLGQARAAVAGAEQAQIDLGNRLDEARERLPAVTAEAERAGTAAAEAEALRHATYYRLASAESALASVRKRQNLGQRLHLAPASSEVAEQRATVASRRLEAEQALARATELHEAAQRAEAERAAVTGFLESGDREIGTAREAYRRASADIPRFEEELLPARAEHERLAAVAAEAADQARRTAEPADEARRLGIAAEERLAAARAALAAAEKNTVETAAAVTATTQGLVDAEAALAEHEKASAAETARLRGVESEARDSLEWAAEQAAQVLDGEPEDAWRERSAARLALLTERPAEAAAVTCALPDTVPPGVWDVLYVTGASAATDGDVLPGAVRTRRQVLVGDPSGPAPVVEPGLRTLLAALAVLGGGRADAAPETVAEAERLTVSGLWGALYAESYGKILRRLAALGLEPVAALDEALASQLETSVFARCLAAAQR
ncbi:hypothetical protein LO762_09975 [Actinocorallia sp. API 0066]|uniref:hypothetical protein n=1 Tax=Actinocorallia sp. API 0066 TaxID=2896846 RepID=UPI001E452668|nr:hypothetical protein [Actinocorallia sp. API 0066]MCD0449517.1 hypothetical protein [Actinocorallia sp. API 0066]